MSAREAALRLAAAGFPTFPARAGRKEPATEHGCLDASTDRVMVTAMFSAAGERANVAIATGRHIVVDLDGARGVESWQRLTGEHGSVGTLTARTPRGWHVYLESPANIEIRNSASRVGPGIDVRGVGGYVIASPSRIDATADHPGGSYSWVRWSHTKPVLSPAWLLPLMLPPVFEPVPIGPPVEIGDRYVDAAVRGEVARVTSAVVGTRNMALRAASYSLGRLVGAGVLGHGVAEQQLRAAGEAAGLGVVETGRTVARGLRDGALEPRQIQRRAVAA